MDVRLAYHLYRSFWIGLDWLFPPVCGGCGTKGTRWCDECQRKVKSIPIPTCDVCGLPQANPGLCERCQQQRPLFKMLRSWAVFDEPVQTAMHRLKYRRDIGLGEALSKPLAEFVRELDWSVDVVVPIPLGRKRLKERGYNQVAMIAMPLAMQLGSAYLPRPLQRARETRSQVGLSATERKNNVQGAFVATPEKFNGRTVLLVDDVSTTGATLSSAAGALYQSGAKDVFAVTVARALPRHGLQIV